MKPAPLRTYLPDGDLVLLAGPRLTVLLAPSEEATLAGLWRLVDSGADTDSLLEWLVDTGFRSFPLLVCVEASGTGATRVVVRGQPRIRLVQQDNGEQVLSGSDRRTWLDTTVPDVSQVHGGLAVDAPTGSVTGLPLRSGVVRAGGFLLTVDQEADGSGSPLVMPLATAASSPTPAVATAKTPERPLEEVSTAGEKPVPAVNPEAASSEPATNSEEAGTRQLDRVAAPSPVDAPPAATAEPSNGAGLPLPPPSAVPPAPTAESAAGISITRVPAFGEAALTDPDETLADQAVPPKVEPEVPPTSATNGPDDLTTGSAELYDRLFGRTRKASVEGAAVRLAEPDEDLPHGGATDQPGDDPAPAAKSQGQSSVGDHDGRTMTAAQAAQLRRASSSATAPPPPPTPPTAPNSVRAALCPAGHPNPPNSETCRSCGSALASPELHTIPRPVLGALAFDGGPRIPLEGTIVMGRSPKPPASMRQAPPKLVALDSPEHGLSRSHVEVRVEGWSVSVVDLGSTNGTEVVLPGEAPQRLRRGEPFLITPGSQVVLGGEVAGVYEVEV